MSHVRRGSVRWDGDSGNDNATATKVVPITIEQQEKTLHKSHAESLLAEHEEHERRHQRDGNSQVYVPAEDYEPRESPPQTSPVQKMKQVEIFQALDDDAISRLVDAMELETFDRGHSIVVEGDEAGAFYVILEGTVEIRKRTFTSMARGQKIGQLHQYDHFGEAGLIQIVEGEKQVRNASVVAESVKVQVLSLSTGRLTKLMDDGTIDRASIAAGVAEAHRKREARTRWGVARNNVRGKSRSLFS